MSDHRDVYADLARQMAALHRPPTENICPCGCNQRLLEEFGDFRCNGCRQLMCVVSAVQEDGEWFCPGCLKEYRTDNAQSRMIDAVEAAIRALETERSAADLGPYGDRQLSGLLRSMALFIAPLKWPACPNCGAFAEPREFGGVAGSSVLGEPGDDGDSPTTGCANCAR